MSPSTGNQIDPGSGVTKKCKVCKQTVEVKIQKGVPIEVYLSDPFCSSKCAREFYGTTDQISTQTVGRKPKW